MISPASFREIFCYKLLYSKYLELFRNSYYFHWGGEKSILVAVIGSDFHFHFFLKADPEREVPSPGIENKFGIIFARALDKPDFIV